MSAMPVDHVDPTKAPGHALPRGWPAYALAASMPIWWLLGLSMFIWPILAAPLLGAMVVGRWKVLAPRRFGIFLAMILWMVASGVEIHGGQRFLAYGWRLSFYVAGAIIFLYFYNVPRRHVSTRAIVNGLAVFWLATAWGGWLGVLLPNFALKSPAQYVLPHSMLNNQYVYAHVHLQFAEVQTFLGFPLGRPETFYAYTNGWGSSFAILAPFAIAAMVTTTNLKWRNLLACSLLLSVVPVVFSLNRGLWFSLGLGIVYAAIRMGMNRDFRMVRAILVAFAILAVLLVATPLGGLITGRFSHQTGDVGRLQRDQAATQSVADHPVLGNGGPTTNPVAGQSAIGTESQVFLLVYSHGIPGLALYFLWFAYSFFRSARLRNPYAFWAHIALLIALVQAPYYEMTERIPIIMLAAVVAYRAIADDELPPRPRLRRLRRARREPQPQSLAV